MKEVTYKDWQKNPTPRMMFVWDDDETRKEKMRVIYIAEQNMIYPVITLSNNELIGGRYKHCAEIVNARRMTNKELSRWLREKPTRELIYGPNGYIQYVFSYYECAANDEVADTILIREDDGEWRDPLVEVEDDGGERQDKLVEVEDDDDDDDGEW